MPVRRAGIAVAGQEAWTPVRPDDKGAVFTLTLPTGGTHLQTWFALEEGEEMGAYYVYVEQLSPSKHQY